MIWVNKVYSSLISSSWSFISSHLLLLYFLISNVQFLNGPSLLLLSRLNFIDTFHFFILPMIWQNIFSWCTTVPYLVHTPYNCNVILSVSPLLRLLSSISGVGQQTGSWRIDIVICVICWQCRISFNRIWK